MTSALQDSTLDPGHKSTQQSKFALRRGSRAKYNKCGRAPMNLLLKTTTQKAIPCTMRLRVTDC
eukprot:4020348-Amphidinium_carterae.1